MRGFVPTPDAIVDEMTERLFSRSLPSRSSRIVDPGCGEGAFIEGIIRWCKRHHVEVPEIIGIESHPDRAKATRKRFRTYPSVSVLRKDFLSTTKERFDYVIGNPPYVSILQLSEEEREAFRAEYEAARGRFDLYMLFFEQSLRLLKPDGRLVFITPEKYLYVKTCEALRGIVGRHRVVEISLVPEDVFKGLVTYPTITTIDKSASNGLTLVKRRDDVIKNILFPTDGASLLPLIQDSKDYAGGPTLADVCIRISCGVATGADELFVLPYDDLPPALAEFSHPTIAGKQLTPGKLATPTDVMLIPYDKNGGLIRISHLGSLANYLNRRKNALLKRTCTKRKPWHAFHDSLPFSEMLRPKILTKDITKEPRFWIDRQGDIVPRHSVYYIVPRNPDILDDLLAYLQSDEAQDWLRANCQRAANGFLRVQSATLRQLPIPKSFVASTTGRSHKNNERSSQEVAA